MVTRTSAKDKSGGLIICGTESLSGKTVVMSGLAAAFCDEGYEVQAIKPVGIGSRFGFQAESEFISKVTGTETYYERTHYGQPGMMTQPDWNSTIATIRTARKPVLVELPGSTATPLMFMCDEQHFWKDTADMAAAVGYPVLLVTRYGVRTIEQLLVHSQHLILKGVELAGIVLVQTTPDAVGTFMPQDLDVALTRKLGCPFLGTLPYSQSVSVLDQSQGNLVKLLSSHIDVLPLADLLKLPLTV